MRRPHLLVALAAVLLPLAATAAGAPPFTGRYHVGPDPAPIRIVVFSDYECSSCERLEAEIQDVLAHHPDVSLSIKQYPFSAECNTALKTSPHPNACWAARVAETAGILRGNDGFWEMHHWLFGHQGSFTDASLATWLPMMGYDPAQFHQVMQDDEVLRRIRADTAEGTALGLYTTPGIFLNGVELKVGSSRVDLQACKLEYSIVSPK